MIRFFKKKVDRNLLALSENVCELFLYHKSKKGKDVYISKKNLQSPTLNALKTYSMIEQIKMEALLNKEKALLEITNFKKGP